MRVARLSLISQVLVLAFPLFAADKMDGKLTANGKTAKLTHVYATTKTNPFDKKKTDVVVIALDRELTPEVLFDEFEMMRATDGANGFSAEIDDEGSVISGQIFSPNFQKMNSFSSTGSQKAELTTRTADRIAGRVWLPKPDDFFGNKYEYSATFDIPMSKKPAPVARKGTPLPAGGGEPAKAYQAYRKAMKAADFASLKKMIVPEMVKQMDDPEFKQMFPMIQEMQPKNITITGGVMDGNDATLDVLNKDEKNSLGTITMVKMNGAWMLKKESWKTTSE
jgi:hypothetical protein